MDGACVCVYIYLYVGCVDVYVCECCAKCDVFQKAPALAVHSNVCLPLLCSEVPHPLVLGLARLSCWTRTWIPALWHELVAP